MDTAWKLALAAAVVGVGAGLLLGDDDQGGDGGDSSDSSVADRARQAGRPDSGESGDGEEGEALTCPDCGTTTLADGRPIQTEAQLQGHRGTHSSKGDTP